MLGGGGESDQENPMKDAISQQLKQIFGDEIFRIAHLTVSWASGGKKESVELAHLLVNQQTLDQTIESLPPVLLKQKDESSGGKKAKDSKKKQSKDSEEKSAEDQDETLDKEEES